MKKIYCLALVLMTSAALCACTFVRPSGKEADVPAETALPSQEPAATATPVPEETPTPVQAVSQRVFVYFDTRKESFKDPHTGSVTILNFSCETPRVYLENAPDASDRINEFFDRLNLSYFSNPEYGVSTEMDLETYLLAQAEDRFTLHAENPEAFESLQIMFSRKAQILRADDRMISILLTDYTLADETEVRTAVYSFDPADGRLLTEEEAASENYAAYPRPDGGEISAARLEEISGTDIIDLIDLSDDGEEIAVFSEGPVYDVQISRADYAGKFFESEKLWYCNILDSCAVQIRAVIPEGVPNLMVTCSDAAGSQKQAVISWNGDTGAIVLIPVE